MLVYYELGMEGPLIRCLGAFRNEEAAICGIQQAIQTTDFAGRQVILRHMPEYDASHNMVRNQILIEGERSGPKHQILAELHGTFMVDEAGTQ